MFRLGAGKKAVAVGGEGGVEEETRLHPEATGFMPWTRNPACRKARRRPRLTSVLPQPVSVPVTKKPFKLLSPLA